MPASNHRLPKRTLNNNIVPHLQDGAIGARAVEKILPVFSVNSVPSQHTVSIIVKVEIQEKSKGGDFF